VVTDLLAQNGLNHTRIKRGLCPKCAYDLRGTTSEACPECGAQK